MFKKRFKYFLMFKISILVFITITYVYSDRFKVLSYNIIDHYLYDGPPIYKNTNFKNTEPNTVCQYLKNHNLNAGIYKRKTYFEYECKSLNRISINSNFSNQYIVTGDKYNVKKIEIVFKILKDSNEDLNERMFSQINTILDKLELNNLDNKEIEIIKSNKNFIKKFNNEIYFSITKYNNEINIAFE